MNKDTALILKQYQLLSENILSSGNMSVEQLKNYLMEIRGATPVYVELEAPAKMNKKDRAGNLNPFLGAVKHSSINGMAGGDWETMMKTRELQAHSDDPNYQPSYEVGQLWKGAGERVSPLLAIHKPSGEYYLAITFPRKGISTYTFEGIPIDASKLTPFFSPKPIEQKKQAEVGIAKENQITPNYVKLSNIRKIRIKNVELNII